MPLIFTFIFFFFSFIFKFYIIVLVLPNIKMNPPQVYMCSPSWTLLPPPSPYQPSGSSQCTSPKHPVSCIEPGLATHLKIWNASRICVSSLRRGHANLLCIVPILVYVLPKRALYIYFFLKKILGWLKKKSSLTNVTYYLSLVITHKESILSNDLFSSFFSFSFYFSFLSFHLPFLQMEE